MHTADIQEIQVLAAQAANRYARRFRSLDVADMVQEATVAALAALRTFDPSKGVPFRAYAWRAAILHLRAWCWLAVSPVSGASHRPEMLAGVSACEMADQHEEGAQVVACEAPWAEELLADQTWKLRVRETLTTLLQQSAVGDDAALALGVMLEEKSTQEVAQEHGASVERVQRAARVGRALAGNSAAMFGLLKEAL
jgi:RNA polymerase sigma factor (sigma-70 family)